MRLQQDAGCVLRLLVFDHISLCAVSSSSMLNFAALLFHTIQETVKYTTNDGSDLNRPR
jgi:hypothetical protein